MTELGLFYCAAVWGATFYMVKGALADVHPVVLVAYRFLLAALCLLPWAARRARPLDHLKEGAILATLLAALYVSQTVGLRYTTASNSGFITGLFILFVPLFLLLFFSRPPAKAQWLAVGVALAGLWILTGGARGFNRGDALTLVAAATYAGHLLATDVFVKADADAVLLAFHQFWMTGTLCLALALLRGASLGVASRRGAGVIAFLALFPTLSAFFIQMLAQKSAPALRVALIFSLEPAFAAVFAWTLGGEAFRWSAAAGGALILGAMVLSELSKLPRALEGRNEVLPV